MTTIFIIAGFKAKKDNVQLRWMKSFFRQCGYTVEIFAADWDYHVMSDYVADFEDFYTKHKSTDNYVLGFSFGAMIALLSAKNLKPDRLYLCSLSPYFKEDVPKLLTRWQRMIGIRRINDFKTHSFKRAVTDLSIPTTILYGEAEGEKFPNLKKRCEATHQALTESKLVVVPDAPHQINHPEYISSIKALF